MYSFVKRTAALELFIKNLKKKRAKIKNKKCVLFYLEKHQKPGPGRGG